MNWAATCRQNLQMTTPEFTADDHRFMAEAIAVAREHLARTAANPSVGTVIVKDGVILGRGVTAIGGRPHAETIALAEAGEAARGATAYVTLEPCAHHGRTPPCAEALVSAGIARVVTAVTDPDERVAGRGHAILRAAGIRVDEGLMTAEAFEGLSAYLMRSSKKRVEVTLKLAVSADGLIGRQGEGQVAITGPEARRVSHVMRAEHNAILVGIGTALADDPELTCRIEGMEDRSPLRIVLDSAARLPLASRLVATLDKAPLAIATAAPDSETARALASAGCRIIPCERHDGRIALPELVEDLAAQGLSSLLVEGGAATVAAFVAEGLADKVDLFESPRRIGGPDGVVSPLVRENLLSSHRLMAEEEAGTDRISHWRAR